MIHIDRNTQAYFDALDRNYSSASPRPSLGIEKEIIKVFDGIQEDWDSHFNRVDKGLSSLKTKLELALSDPLPHYYKGKQRPRLRKFPYMDTGDLVGSMYGDASKSDGDNSMTITINAGFTSEHAQRTNDADNSFKRDVHWFHWMDEIFGDNINLKYRRHSTKVPNIRDVLLGYYS